MYAWKDKRYIAQHFLMLMNFTSIQLSTIVSTLIHQGAKTSSSSAWGKESNLHQLLAPFTNHIFFTQRSTKYTSRHQNNINPPFSLFLHFVLIQQQVTDTNCFLHFQPELLRRRQSPGPQTKVQRLLPDFKSKNT